MTKRVEPKWCEHIFYMVEAGEYLSSFKFMKQLGNYIYHTWKFCPLCGTKRPTQKTNSLTDKGEK
jgi:hypothetical protein